MQQPKTSWGAIEVVLQRIDDYKALTKFRLSSLVVFSAATAYLLGVRGAFSLTELFMLVLGGFLVTGASNALNQVLERDYDRLMTRTADRPLPAGRMDVSEAVLAAGLMSGIGILIFALFFNAQSAMLSTLSLISYSFIYTPMKRVSPLAVWIGAVPGALPMMIGWVAATGYIGVEGWFLFTVQFFWQFPHFWAIAWVSFEDYAKGGFFLLPSREGRDKASALQCVLYALALVPIGLLPWWTEMTGWAFSATMVVLGLGYVAYSLRLYASCALSDARKLMFYSFAYLPIVLIGLLIDLLFSR
jgi:protoheme IX farnesyltransferase